jgi:hypothetical protein
LNNHWIGLAAVLIASYGAGLYYEQNFAPTGCCGLTWPSSDPDQAQRILLQSDPKAVDAAAQMQAAKTILQGRPGDANAWLRLSYADWLTHGGQFSNDGRRALETSYLITPYGGPFTAWRVALALSNWSGLSNDTRRDVAKEVEIVKNDQFAAATRAAAEAVRDPQGHLAAVRMGLIS